ncbi:MAG TPA: helix-turn-helix domain-containing protein [Candidatus Binatia bacterium]|nr:helix-turn-helix domain-containing protein [Candidatus Binatia bacterium]
MARWSPPYASPLTGLIERIWYFEGTMTYPRERVFPDGAAELIVMLDEPHRDGDSESLEPFPAICINGLRTRPSVVVAPPGRCRVIGVTFFPLGAALFLQSTMSDLLDVTIDVRDALGTVSQELGERCTAAAQSSAWNTGRNAAATVRAAARWTSRRIGTARGDALVQWATRSIREKRGALSLDKLGAVLGVTRAQFAQRFCEYTGLSPKRFARIVRFQHALALLGSGEDIATVAAELGYYDQPHMYRDFAEFARMSPGEFLSANRYPASASLAEH